MKYKIKTKNMFIESINVPNKSLTGHKVLNALHTCDKSFGEVDMDPYNLMYYLFREIVELEHKVIQLRQEVNRTSPQKDLMLKPYQDVYSDLSCYYNDHPGYKKYVEIYHEKPYDGNWGQFPNSSDSYEEMILGKKDTY